MHDPERSARSVLVLGANGRFGQAEIQAFAAAGWRVLAQARREPPQPLPAGVRWLARPMADTAMRLMLAPEAGQSLADLTAPTDGRRIELLIGAEGGLAPEEMEQAAAAGFVPIRLGPRILRTETAGLAALAAIQCLWGDFEGRDKGEGGREKPATAPMPAAEKSV